MSNAWMKYSHGNTSFSIIREANYSHNVNHRNSNTKIELAGIDAYNLKCEI